MSTTPKDLSKEAPRSPRIRLNGYAIMARMIDKGRAVLADTANGYHFACPLDMMLFNFKGINPDDVKELLAAGRTDQEIADWIDSHGTEKTAEEIKAWSDQVEASRPYENPEKKDWFVGVCAEAGIDPEKSTLFDYLETDDRISYPAA
jgi:hypothetical protein